MTTVTDTKHIQYNRLDRDYSASYDGEFIGAYATYHAAELALDDHALYLAEQGLADTTTYPPIGECTLCGAAAWQLDETTTAPLCPDHKCVENEWIANRDTPSTTFVTAGPDCPRAAQTAAP